jgi:hypothetical protein
MLVEAVKAVERSKDLQRGVALGRVDRLFGVRLVHFAPDRGEAHLERGRGLPVGMTGGDQVEKGLPALDTLRQWLATSAPRSSAANIRAFGRWRRWELALGCVA